MTNLFYHEEALSSSARRTPSVEAGVVVTDHRKTLNSRQVGTHRVYNTPIANNLSEREHSCSRGGMYNTANSVAYRAAVVPFLLLLSRFGTVRVNFTRAVNTSVNNNNNTRVTRGNNLCLLSSLVKNARQEASTRHGTSSRASQQASHSHSRTHKKLHCCASFCIATSCFSQRCTCTTGVASSN